MPLYDYKCVEGHEVELRRGIGDETIPCPICGQPSQRAAFYLDQTIVTETGTLASRQAVVPRDERNYKDKYSRFQEASAEIDYHATKVEDNTGQEVKTELWKKASRKAVKIKGGQVAPLGVS